MIGFIGTSLQLQSIIKDQKFNSFLTTNFINLELICTTTLISLISTP
jgi:hypothetical protein